MGSNYVKKALDSLRHFSKAYIHGHSVGGTNPSLLEAMSSQCFILSHDNPFNRGVLESDAVYFSGVEDLAQHFRQIDHLAADKSTPCIAGNLAKIVDRYNWDVITRTHEELFQSLMKAQGL